MVRRLLIVAFVLSLTLLLHPMALVQADSSFIVTKTADTNDGTCDADCSLREAITAVNADPDTTTITFNIPGTGVHTIQPASALPTVTAPTIIDGTTQSDFNGAPLIELDGSLLAGVPFTNGLMLQSSGNTVRGLIVNGFTFGGIFMSVGGGNTIVGNYIGTDSAGATAKGNRDGIYVLNSSNNTIGGTTAADRNIISGNTDDGIDFANLGAGPFPTHNTVEGNTIGVDVSGTQPLGNLGDGIKISERSDDNLIGGTTSGTGNIIAFNNGRGVYSEAVSAFATGNRILGNSIFSNNGLGIDLAGDGATANDAGDADTGSNNLQNYPIVMGTSPHPGGIRLTGTFNSLPNASYRLEFFVSPTCDPASSGEGKTYLGFTDVHTDALGNAAFSLNLSGTMATPDIITATATDSANNTSEFSRCAFVENAPLPPIIPPRNYFSIDTPTLTWKGVDGATSYEVEVDDNANFDNPDYETVVATRFVTTTPLANGTYYWRVRGKNGSHVVGLWSAAEIITVKTP